MQITTTQFIKALGQSNISLEMKKNIISNLQDLTLSKFEEIYNILLKNVEEQKSIISRFRRKTKMLNFKFEMKLKSDIKTFKINKNR